MVVERPSRLEAAITHSDRPQSLALRCDPSHSDAAREVTCTAAGAARLVVERIEPGVYPVLVIGAAHGRAVVEVRLEPL